MNVKSEEDILLGKLRSLSKWLHSHPLKSDMTVFGMHGMSSSGSEADNWYRKADEAKKKLESEPKYKEMLILIEKLNKLQNNNQ
jgi:transcriptional regulator of NAD metabolism